MPRFARLKRRPSGPSDEEDQYLRQYLRETRGISCNCFLFNGATRRDRTGDLLITN